MHSSTHNLQSKKFAWQTATKSDAKKKKTVDKKLSEIQFEFPGWKQISDGGKRLHYRLIWGFIILSSFLMCGYQTSERFRLFLSNPISIEIIVQQNDSVKFPSFIVCPDLRTLEKFVPYQRKLAEETNVSLCAISLGEVLRKFNFSLTKFWSHVEVRSILRNPNFHDWSLRRLNRNSPLVVTDLPMPYGICMKISIPELLPFRKEASSLLLYSRDYTNCGRSPFAYHISVRADDDHIKYRPFYDIIEIQHKSEYSYGVSAKQLVHLNTEKNPCSDYATVNRCQDKCLEKYSLTKIKCTLPNLEFETNLPNCTTIAEYDRTVHYVMMMSLKVNYRQDCNCPRPCEETIYKYSYKSLLADKIARVSIYFEDNQIELMREYYPYTVIPLLCDVGGNLGLFLGLCIPTVLENIESVMRYFKRKIFDRLV